MDLSRAARALWGLTTWTLRVGLFLAVAVVVFVLSMWSTVEDHFAASAVVVPDVRGLSEDAAGTKLSGVGLRFTVEETRPDEVVEAGLVLFQDPSPGAAWRKGREVKVILSAGLARFATPPLIGHTRREAIIALRNAELSVGEVLQVHSSRPAEDVLAQAPAPGAALDPSGRVGLLVSRGMRRPAFVMPDLAGHRVSEAERLFGQVGMRIAEVKEQFIPGIADGTIQSQSPARGTRVTRESSIRLVVSRTSPL